MDADSLMASLGYAEGEDSDIASSDGEGMALSPKASKKAKKVKKDKKVKKAKKDKKDKKAKKAKKEKKEKKKRKRSDDSDDDADDAEGESKIDLAASLSAAKAAAAAAAAVSDDDDDDDSDASGEPSRKRRKVSSSDGDEGKDGGEGKDAKGNPPISDFKISAATQAALRKRGVTHLFPIQVATFDHVLAGKDLIGKARTGSGKTLAFTLPVTEQLLDERCAPRAPPKVLVMCPTRELAIQVHREMESVAPHLRMMCIYGGSSYVTQERAMSRGVEVVVGTPGRIIDHLNRGNLRIDELRFFILDEADRMLDMGFQEDIEKVMSFMPQELRDRGLQTLLFSATVPPFVKHVSKRYMKEPVVVDVVGSGKEASTDVDHLCVMCGWQERPGMVSDLVRVYAGAEGRSIVFCDTKRDCNELAADPEMAHSCRVLHGDIPQAQRESTLKAFRNHKFRCLVATDVAARGLDISGVDLVIQSQPPAGRSGRPDVDTYVHRSGRTGRAGRKGSCITIFKAQQQRTLKDIEQAIGNTIKRIPAPQPKDIARAGADLVVAALVEDVDDSVLPLFDAAADKLVQKVGGDSREAIKRCLAKLTDYTSSTAARSMLSSQKGFVTLIFRALTEFRTASYAWTALKRDLSPEACNAIRGMTIGVDHKTAVFDLPTQYLKEAKYILDDPDHPVSICTEIPELEIRTGGFGGRGGRGGRGGFRRGGRGGGGGFRRGGRGGGFRRGGGGGFRGGGRGGGRGGFRRF